MNFKTYPKIKVLGEKENKDIFLYPDDEIVIEEKMDGANFRFMVQGDSIIFGSRTQQLDMDSEHKYQKNFNRCILFIKNCFDELNAETKKHSDKKIFFGENMVKHTLNYNWEKIPPFLGFDIFDLQSNKFLLLKNRRNLFNAWNLPQVPLIDVMQSKDIKEITDSSVPNSFYCSFSSEDLQAEGIIFKNYERNIFAKYVREKFREKNREVFGRNKKFAKTDDEYFVAVYCTNARIDKCLFKLIDEGKQLNMELMEDLLKVVYKDIWEENWNEISLSKKKIDLLNLKKLISKRCLEVLKQTITNNALIQK